MQTLVNELLQKHAGNKLGSNVNIDEIIRMVGNLSDSYQKLERDYYDLKAELDTAESAIDLEEVKEILKGIDKDEVEDGWWETSTGASFGASKLNELLNYLEENK